MCPLACSRGRDNNGGPLLGERFDLASCEHRWLSGESRGREERSCGSCPTMAIQIGFLQPPSFDIDENFKDGLLLDHYTCEWPLSEAPLLSTALVKMMGQCRHAAVPLSSPYEPV